MRGGVCQTFAARGVSSQYISTLMEPSVVSNVTDMINNG